MTDWLVSAAEVSNLVSFISVVFSFTAMFLFLLKLIGDDVGGNGSLTKVTNRPPRINFSKILLPFKIKLFGVKETYKIELSLTALTEGWMRAYWGVDINSFHQVLRAPRDWFHSAFTHGNLFGKEKCAEFSEIRSIQKVDEAILCVEKPTSRPLQLGPAPRDIYPCVVVLVCRDSALIVALHIRDEECSVPSQVLAEYYKHGDSSTQLQSLFVASSDVGENSDTESQEESDTEDLIDSGGRRRTGRPSMVARCIICQVHRINRVVLPCRHASTCATCFSRLQNCPMCRGFIQSYFLIGREVEQPEPESTENRTQPVLQRSWRESVTGWIRSAWRGVVARA